MAYLETDDEKDKQSFGCRGGENVTSKIYEYDRE